MTSSQLLFSQVLRTGVENLPLKTKIVPKMDQIVEKNLIKQQTT